MVGKKWYFSHEWEGFKIYDWQAKNCERIGAKGGTDINFGVPFGQVSTEKEITFEWENETSCVKNKIKNSILCYHVDFAKRK